MKEYQLGDLTFRMTEDDARRLGATPVQAKARAPQNKEAPAPKNTKSKTKS